MQNRLIQALPRDVTEGFQSAFERVALARGNQPGDTIEHLYFPLSCLVSITVTMWEGKTAEAGAAGNREVVGVNAFMGGSETTQTFVHIQLGMRELAQTLVELAAAANASNDE